MFAEHLKLIPAPTLLSTMWLNGELQFVSKVNSFFVLPIAPWTTAVWALTRRSVGGDMVP